MLVFDRVRQMFDVRCSKDRLAGWRVGYYVRSSGDLLAGWLAGSLAGWLAGWVVGWHLIEILIFQ